MTGTLHVARLVAMTGTLHVARLVAAVHVILTNCRICVVRVKHIFLPWRRAGNVLLHGGSAADVSGLCGGHREHLEISSYPGQPCRGRR